MWCGEETTPAAPRKRADMAVGWDLVGNFCGNRHSFDLLPDVKYRITPEYQSFHSGDWRERVPAIAETRCQSRIGRLWPGTVHCTRQGRVMLALR